MLRSLIQKVDKQTKPEPKHNPERDISQWTDAINFLLTTAGCPPEHRAFIDALIGAAHEKASEGTELDWFEASDLEVGRRALADRHDDVSRGALKKWTQRRRKAFLEWQKQAGLTLIECQPGGQDNEKNNYSSRYRLPLLSLPAEVLREAQDDPAWNRNVSISLQSAAKMILASLPDTPGKRERFRRPRQTDEAMLSRDSKTIQTLISKDIGIFERQALQADLAGSPERRADTLDQANNYFAELKAALAKAEDRIKALSAQPQSKEPPEAVHSFNTEENGQTQGGAANRQSAQPPPLWTKLSTPSCY